MASFVILALCALLAFQCGAGDSLSREDMAKLDPGLQQLVTERSPTDAGYDITVRGDGVKEYGVIIRSDRPEDLRDAGIRVGSVFGDVITARVSVEELRRIVTLPSVRAIEQGSTIKIH
jgi:hypothetical protein